MPKQIVAISTLAASVCGCHVKLQNAYIPAAIKSDFKPDRYSMSAILSRLHSVPPRCNKHSGRARSRWLKSTDKARHQLMLMTGFCIDEANRAALPGAGLHCGNVCANAQYLSHARAHVSRIALSALAHALACLTGIVRHTLPLFYSSRPVCPAYPWPARPDILCAPGYARDS